MSQARHARARSPARDGPAPDQGGNLYVLAAVLGAVIAFVAFVVSGQPIRPAHSAQHPPSPQPAAFRAGSARAGLPALPNGPTGPAHAAPSNHVDAGVPIKLTVPAIGVDSGLQPLGLMNDGTLEPPSQWGEAGWYADGVRPGDPGPAVIVGHVDSVSGPAVFYRLRDLRPGAVALIQQQNGPTLRFVVDSVRSYPKASFPTDAVYGPTPLPELRLVTCTGEFDWNAHSYLDNLVVSAHLS